MQERENIGYKIIASVAFPDFEFVLGEKESGSGTQYVTWRYSGNGYYYGHYITSKVAAWLDLYERVQDEAICRIAKYEDLLNQGNNIQ